MALMPPGKELMFRTNKYRWAFRLSLVIMLTGWLAGVFIRQVGATFPVTVSSTSRDAILTYAAPDTNPCTVEVSESNTYSPVIADVNATLFSGANSDSRAGSLG